MCLPAPDTIQWTHFNLFDYQLTMERRKQQSGGNKWINEIDLFLFMQCLTLEFFRINKKKDESPRASLNKLTFDAREKLYYFWREQNENVNR